MRAHPRPPRYLGRHRRARTIRVFGRHRNVEAGQREVQMNRFFLSLVAYSLAATPAHRAVSTAAAAESEKAPMMVSFAELKWRELPERKGTQFAVLSGDP